MSGTQGPSGVNRGGTLFFKVDAVAYDLAGTFNIKWGGIVRDPVVGPNAVNGYKTKYAAPMVDCELQDGDAVLLATLQRMGNNTQTIELENGKSYVMINAWQNGDITLDAAETKIKTAFAAKFIEELTG
jgi:hypothetical protein